MKKTNKIKLNEVTIESFRTTSIEQYKGGLMADRTVATEFGNQTCAPYPCVPDTIEFI